jgi:inosine-uridine nucleoside N-ribohydrolase
MTSASGLVARVHIDTDPGLDDLLALAFALACPELRVVALTTVAGNTGLDAVTDNALRFCALAGLQVPVGRGAAQPRALDPASAIGFHGPDGRRGVALPSAVQRPLPSARDVLRQSLVERRVELVIALGPLTNVAELVLEEPELFAETTIVWMGGALEGGNVTPAAEFNAYADPAAADAVLRSGLDVRVIGLDVTCCAALREADLAPGALGDGQRGRFLDAVLRGLMDAEQIALGERVALLHDPCAIAAALGRDLFRWERKRLAVCAEDGPDRGRLMERRGFAGADAAYAVEIDHARVVKLVLERLRLWSGAGELLRRAL